MAFSSRLKRKEPAISAAQSCAMGNADELVALARKLGDLVTRLETAPANERQALEREAESIMAQIDELIHGS